MDQAQVSPLTLIRKGLFHWFNNLFVEHPVKTVISSIMDFCTYCVKDLPVLWNLHITHFLLECI